MGSNFKIKILARKPNFKVIQTQDGVFFGQI
jgi:hypothetical protein